MLQRLPVALPLQKLKEAIIQKIYKTESDKLFIFCISQNKLLKKYIIG